MARPVRHLTGIAALLAGRGIDLIVLKQGIDTASVTGRFTFHVLAAMDEMLADLISEGTKEGLASAQARGRIGGPKPRLSARQAEVARGMYAETGSDGKRRYAVDESAGTFQSPARLSTGTLTRTTPSGNRTRARGRGPSPGPGTVAPPLLARARSAASVGMARGGLPSDHAQAPDRAAAGASVPGG